MNGRTQVGKHLFEISCDSCSIVIKKSPVITQSKAGKEVYFCSDACYKRGRKKKGKRHTDIISASNAALFVTESNAIENIVYPDSHALLAWTSKLVDYPEIRDHVKALKYVTKNYKNDINISSIEKLHKLLMRELLPNRFQGIRTCLVRVGNRTCPFPIAIRPMLDTWCGIVNNLVNPSEETLWQTHLAYEYIHPFADGNGRSGRLLWLWLRYKHGFSFRCIYNSTKFEEYYPQFDTFVWESWVSENTKS